MTKEAIKAAMDAEPFRPFTIRLAGGSVYPVPSRDLISISPNGRTVVIHGEGNTINTIDARPIASIELSESGVRKTGSK
jgi:hypothetical protein